MPESPPTGAVDPLERQIRQVRRRRNLLELQHALYLLIATVAGSAALLVIFALGASVRFFSITVCAVGAASLVTGAMLALEARRRWLDAAQAATWIDARAKLRGRLATLIELRARAVRPADAFFLPLLTDENVRRLSSWSPARLVARRIPRGALSAALAATGLLMLALTLAPGLRPQEPEVIYSDRPIDGLEANEPDDGLPDRVVVAPRSHSRTNKNTGAGRGADGNAESDEQSALTRLGSALQERIRRELWGDAWERMRDAMARADAARQGDAARGDLDDGEDGPPGDDWAAFPPEQLAARPRPRGIEGAGGFEPTNDAAPDAGMTRNDTANQEGGAGDGARAAGAGNDTDPNLFGRPSKITNGAATMFELALAAPVRARRGAPRRPGGEPPPPAPDARPELGTSQREQAPLNKMVVPAAYESIVREVFAHRAPPDEAAP